jgi:hypothetical protein
MIKRNEEDCIRTATARDRLNGAVAVSAILCGSTFHFGDFNRTNGSAPQASAITHETRDLAFRLTASQSTPMITFDALMTA